MATGSIAFSSFRRASTGQCERGQTLVEFALVFSIFWAVLIGLVEFAFIFQAVLAVSFASRNAARIASEPDNLPTGDCSILCSIRCPWSR